MTDWIAWMEALLQFVMIAGKAVLSAMQIPLS